MRVGGVRPIQVDARVLFATNRDLEQLVAEGRFRLDLYHRIRGLTIEIPPLRARPDDIPPIARTALDDVAGEVGHAVDLAEDALQLLVAQPWPGNVRELMNVIRSVAILADRPVLTAAHFAESAGLDPRAVGAASPAGAWTGAAANPEGVPAPEIGEGFSLSDAKRQLEVACIQSALARTGGNITKAAGLLGMKRPRLSQKIKELGILVPR